MEPEHHLAWFGGVVIGWQIDIEVAVCTQGVGPNTVVFAVFVGEINQLTLQIDRHTAHDAERAGNGCGGVDSPCQKRQCDEATGNSPCHGASRHGKPLRKKT